MTKLSLEERLERIKQIAEIAEELRDSYEVDTAAPDYHERKRYAGTLEYYHSGSEDFASAARMSLINKLSYSSLKLIAPLLRDLADMDRLFWERKNRGE